MKNRVMDYLDNFQWHSRDTQITEEFIFKNVQGHSRLKDFYKTYFPKNLTRMAMNTVLLRKIIKPGQKILDVGSFGLELSILKKEFLDCSFNAISFEGFNIGINENGFYETEDLTDKNCVFGHQVDVEKDIFPFPDNYFDIVSCFEIIDHLKFSPVPMLKEVQRTLKPDGIVLLTTPNINSVGAINRILLGRSPQECPVFHRELEYGVMHPKEYSIHQIRELLVNLGFKIEVISAVHTSPISASEKFLTFLTPVLYFILKKIFRKSVGEKPCLGNNIFVAFGKGGSLINEFPAAIFHK